MSASPAASMPMRMMGNTGMQCSVLSFGFWATFGVKGDLMDQNGVKIAKEILRECRNAGVNLFDNAETYGRPQGAAESCMGQAIEELAKEDPVLWRRSDLLLTTKIFWGGNGVNEKGLSRKHVMEGIEASLKRLRLSYVDLVFCHRPDPYTPTETVVRAMTDIVRAGKAMNWGTSEWSAQQITEAYWIAKTLGLEPPCFEQPQYNMFCRDRVEKEYFPIYRAPYHIGTTIWSPLASGLLTGKYLNGIPAGSRADTEGYEFIKSKVENWTNNGEMNKVGELQKYAEKTLECTVAQLALAWCIRNANVTTTLMGATSAAQIHENLKSLAIAQTMSAVDDEAVEKILGNKPEDFSGWQGAGMRGLERMEYTDVPMRIPNYVAPVTKAKNPNMAKI